MVKVFRVSKILKTEVDLYVIKKQNITEVEVKKARSGGIVVNLFPSLS